ncbi:hypothetical protein KXV64_004566 [Aspergillus fumigatus]|nr:hypothetical protein KXV64_004566 [Aspergillus fumigatus]
MSASKTVTSSASAVSTSSGRSTPSKLVNGATRNGSAAAGNGSSGTAKGKRRSKYRHVAAYHSELRHSSLSRETSVVPSFLGFRNLMVIVLVAMNLRLIIENFMKYGVLICIKCHDYRKQDVVLGSILFALVPCHLFLAYIIELVAAQQSKKTVGRQKKDLSTEEREREQQAFRSTWRYTAFFHTVNATLCLAVTSFVVYFYINHPGIGTISVFIWLLSAQYAAPVLRNSIDKIAVTDIASILERVMKLSTISLVIWLAGFFALFQSLLNALAEVMRFGDREFYTDWWNSPSLGAYWRSWNRPVYLFMKRHVFSPLVGRGWSPFAASFMVFSLSAVLHEMLVGIPTHNLIGVAFAGMMFQLPLIAVTAPFEKVNDALGKIVGNSIFWVSFCLVGQPLGALLYFFAWQAKYGSVSKIHV